MATVEDAKLIVVEAGAMLRNLASRLRDGMDIEEVATRAEGAAMTLDVALGQLDQ
jgi:hypothetical protein